MKTRVIFLVLLASISLCHSCGQQPIAGDGKSFTLFSWNVENLFDTVDDSLTLDDDFTPGGLMHWDRYRYYLKIRAVWKTILSTADGRPPSLIALCEVENGTVLKDLLVHSPFGKYEYRIVHRESPDQRGIDVALAWDPAVFELCDSAFFQPLIPAHHPTRDILYAKLRHGSDTLHVFVNHWPSKYGGTGYTGPYRKAAGATLRRLIDSVAAFNERASIICTGDFNDVPGSGSLEAFLDAAPSSASG